ncbi:MAG: hypothetical protein ACUVUG_07010 [Candidatus Aminicenantia bacterium]
MIAITPLLLKSPIFKVDNFSVDPFKNPQKPNRHPGVDGLIELMGRNGLKFYNSSSCQTPISSSYGLIR